MFELRCLLQESAQASPNQPCLIEAELASGQLVLPFSPAVATDRGYYLCSRAALADNEAVEQFTRWLVDESKASTDRFGLTPPPP